jgi:RNA polymerase sigma-70 factor (ECF subfamily)
MTKEEFASIYEEFSPKLYRYIFYRVDDHSTSEDLISQVFFKALKNLEKFDVKKGKISTWLYTIASHIIIDHYRQDEEYEALEDHEEDLSYQVHLGQNIDTKMHLENVMVALQKLPLKTQEIITLRIFEELPFVEIAKIIGI